MSAVGIHYFVHIMVDLCRRRRRRLNLHNALRECTIDMVN